MSLALILFTVLIWAYILDHNNGPSYPRHRKVRWYHGCRLSWGLSTLRYVAVVLVLWLGVGGFATWMGAFE